VGWGFLNITTSKTKNGFLLIETFRKTKLWPPGDDPWWPFLVGMSFMMEPNIKHGKYFFIKGGFNDQVQKAQHDAA
jgi:hypothetical protein